MDNSPASSSTSGNSNDGHLIELLATQIDSDSIATVINYQKNSLVALFLYSSKMQITI